MRLNFRVKRAGETRVFLLTGPSQTRVGRSFHSSKRGQIVFIYHEPYSIVGVMNVSGLTCTLPNRPNCTALAKNFDTFTSILRHAAEGYKLKPD